jgi:hypothetical protein
VLPPTTIFENFIQVLHPLATYCPQTAPAKLLGACLPPREQSGRKTYLEIITTLSRENDGWDCSPVKDNQTSATHIDGVHYYPICHPPTARRRSWQRSLGSANIEHQLALAKAFSGTVCFTILLAMGGGGGELL